MKFKIRKYQQTTFETCLAVCLLNILGVKITPKREREIFYYALNFSKDNFVVGHLDFVARKFGAKIDFYIDNKSFFNFIKKFKFSKNISLIQEKINLKLIDKLLKISPVIVYLDAYYLLKIVHYPHFIIVIKKLNDEYKIFDPWQGKIKNMNSKILSKSISSLRNHLKFCPLLITKA